MFISEQNKMRQQQFTIDSYTPGNNMVLPLTHRLPIGIVYKHTKTNIETGLTGNQ